MLKILITSLFVFMIFLNLNAQVVMFSSNPIKKKQFLAFTSIQYSEGSKKYDWKTESWNSITQQDRTATLSQLIMLGYGITNRWSMFLQYPIYEQIKNKDFEFKQGEIILMSRYAITPSSSEKSGLSLLGAVRLPTVPVNSFADGSVDVIVGEIFSTKWYSKWRTHIKSSYYINTKNTINENPGDEFQFYWKQDYKLGRVKIYTNNIFTYQSKKRNAESDLVENSQNYRLLHLLGAEYIIQDKFYIKPKIQIPSVAKGGTLFREKLILDLVYYF